MLNIFKFNLIIEMKKPTKSLRILDEISNELQKVRSPSIGKHSKRMSRSPYILSPVYIYLYIMY